MRFISAHADGGDGSVVEVDEDMGAVEREDDAEEEKELPAKSEGGGDVSGGLLGRWRREERDD